MQRMVPQPLQVVQLGCTLQGFMRGDAHGSLEVCLCIRRSVWVAHVARVQMGFVHNLQGAGSKSILKLPAQGQRHMVCLLAEAKSACSCWNTF